MNAYAVDMGGSHVTCAVVEDAALVASDTLAVRGETLLADMLPAIAKTLSQLRGYAPANNARWAGIAISFCGVVNSVDSLVLSTNGKYPDATLLDLRRWAQEEFGLPLRIENDARMAILGEQYAGAAQDRNDVVMMTLGTGIGAAAIIDGRLLRGKHYLAGCLGGHIPLMLNHRPCSCGGYGCAESEASGWALPSLIQSWPGVQKSALLHEPSNFASVFGCAAKGDIVAQQIRQRCLEVWASVGLALVHAYDPDLLVLGGGVMAGGDMVRAFIERQIQERAWTPWGKVEVRTARLGNDAALLGAIPLLTESRTEDMSYVR